MPAHGLFKFVVQQKKKKTSSPTQLISRLLK